MTSATQTTLSPVTPPVADVNVPRSFTIGARDAVARAVLVGGDVFAVTINGPGTTVPAAIVDQQNGSYVVTFAPTVEGTYTIAVTLSGVPVGLSPPLTCLVQGTCGLMVQMWCRGCPWSKPELTCWVNMDRPVGDRVFAPSKAVVTAPASLAAEQVPLQVTVAARNAAGQPIPVGGERLTACFCCTCAGAAEYAFTDHGNGSYSLAHQMNQRDIVPAGAPTFSFTVRWYAAGSSTPTAVGTSPYSVTVVGGRLSVQKSTFTGQNIVARVGTEVVVTMTPKDPFGYTINRRTSPPLVMCGCLDRVQADAGVMR